MHEVAASGQQASAQGITSTPTFVVGDRKVEGAISYDAFKALVDSLVAAKKKAA
jgi:predicted DsbA family dithiol-disulfide isomerase